MKAIEFENGTVEIDASVVAEGLGIALPLLKTPLPNSLRKPGR